MSEAVKATVAIEVSRVDDPLAHTRALLLVADRATDLRTALLAVHEARVHVELLSVIMRQVAAVEDATQEAQACEDGV
jgi:hypothetical protein